MDEGGDAELVDPEIVRQRLDTLKKMEREAWGHWRGILGALAETERVLTLITGTEDTVPLVVVEDTDG